MEIKNLNHLNPSLVVLMLIMARLLANVSMDIHLPLAPLMAQELETSEFKVQLLFIISVALTTVTPLFWGPLSDCYGRRSFILPSFILMAGGQFVCGAAPSINWLLAARVIQYFGVGAIFTVGLAVICDLFKSKERARIIAIWEISTPIGLIVAPLIGALMASTLGWRFNFYLFGCLEVILLIAIYFYLPETLKKAENFSLSTSIQSIRGILKDSVFFKPILLLAFVNSSYMIFITHASFLYIKDLGVSEIGFALHQGSIVMIYCVGLLIYSQFIHYYSLKTLLNMSMVGYLFYGVLTLFFIFQLIEATPLTITLWLFVSSFVSGPILTSCSSLALEHSNHSLGTQSALIEFLMGSIGAAFMLLSSLAQDFCSLYTITTVTVVASLIAWVRMSSHQRPRESRQAVTINK